MAKFNQTYPRKAGNLCWVNGLVKREEAKVSVLDSVVQGGDAVWEGLRVSQGKIYQLEEHLDRLLASAHALLFEAVPERDAVKQAVFDTLEANNMRDGVHIRLTLTRGEKSTSGMDPRLNVHGCTLVVLPEYKGAVYGDGNLKLITSSVRRNGPSYWIPKSTTTTCSTTSSPKSKPTMPGPTTPSCWTTEIPRETNATNVFLIRDGVLCTPFGHACLPGITRAYMLNLASTLGIPIQEGDFSLTELYTADEAFTTGTMGGLAHIAEVDGRRIGPANQPGPGPVTIQLQQAYPNHIPSVSLPFVQ